MVGKKCYWVLPGTDFMNLKISLLVWNLTTTLVTESQTPRSLTEVASHSPAGKIQFCSSPDPSKGHRDIQMNFTVRDSLTLLIKPNPYLNMCLELPFRQGRAWFLTMKCATHLSNVCWQYSGEIRVRGQSRSQREYHLGGAAKFLSHILEVWAGLYHNSRALRMCDVLRLIRSTIKTNHIFNFSGA